MKAAYAVFRHELRLLASLVLWAARRTRGTGVRFGYARGQGAMMFGLAFVCVIETVGMAVLLRNWPAVHLVVLVLDVYTVLFVIGLHAASVVHPHLLTPDALHVRNGVRLDLRIPLDAIRTVRRETRYLHEKTAGELDVPIGSQTSVTLELAEPVAHFGLLGRRQEVRVVRFHADDATDLVRQLTTTPQLTQARSAPSSSPGRPPSAAPAAVRPAGEVRPPRSGL
ncbi:hypothetical protein ABT404_11610 [Streptomyces hyaluromycini]|uniref:Integral membrane protein n=1 Tax=Streptomyces hyaluromycini TaxID=1377993 RepID=A0ABV1WTM8_9ACTN